MRISGGACPKNLRVLKFKKKFVGAQPKPLGCSSVKKHVNSKPLWVLKRQNNT